MFLQSDKPPTIPRGAGTAAEPETDGSATRRSSSSPSSSPLSGRIQRALSYFLGHIKLGVFLGRFCLFRTEKDVVWATRRRPD